jgi:hypothetical protein
MQRIAEGTLFAVPLQDTGYALGLIARCAPDCQRLLAYFFGQRYPVVPKADETHQLTFQTAIDVAIITDLAFTMESWPLIGPFAKWNRANWPMPRFVRRPILGSINFLVEYDDDNPSEMVSETPLADDIPSLPTDRISGVRTTAARLSRYIGRSENENLHKI